MIGQLPQKSKVASQAVRNTCVALFALLFTACAPEVPPLTRPVRENFSHPSYNRLIFGGDVMFSRGVRDQMLAAKDPALPFRKIAPLMSAADIAFVNLESPFSDVGPYHRDGLVFHAPPDAIAGLRLAGITIASTANNHSRDCRSHGVEFTVAWLRQHSIEPLGSSESASRTHEGVIIKRNGIRFGFLGYTFDQQNGNWHDIDERIAVADIPALQRDISALRGKVDVLIVSIHNGVEYTRKPSKSQRDFAHAAIDCGADVVIGHHPHVVQAEEHYRNRLIFYSLGNLVFDQFQRTETQHGELVELSYLGKKLLSVRVLAVRITPTGPELE